MKIIACAGAALLTLALLSGAAQAWTITQDHGDSADIKCGDSSAAAVAKLDNGNWTATKAGAKGQTGGSFAIIGQAALRACGE